MMSREVEEETEENKPTSAGPTNDLQLSSAPTGASESAQPNGESAIEAVFAPGSMIGLVQFGDQISNI